MGGADRSSGLIGREGLIGPAGYKVQQGLWAQLAIRSGRTASSLGSRNGKIMRARRAIAPALG